MDKIDMADRIQEDIEFVNLLSNPFYIDFLIEKNFFENENFLYYLKSLDYLKDERTFKFVKFPIAWKMLDNIKNVNFIQNWKI